MCICIVMTKLRIRYSSYEPYSFAYIENNKTCLGGIVSEIYEAMKTIMGYDYEAMIQPNGVFGRKLSNGTWTGMLGSIIRNESDIVGPMYVDEERSSASEFAIPLDMSKLCIVTGMEPSIQGPFILYKIFSLMIWISIVLSIILVSGAALFIYQVLPYPKKKKKAETFSKYLWAFQTSAIGKSFGSDEQWFLKHVCRSPSFRIVQGVWFLFAALVLVSTYQGNIVSAYAAQKLVPRIESMEDLVEKQSMGVSTYRGDYMEAFLKTLDGTKYKSVYQRARNNLVAVVPEMWNQPHLDRVEKGQQVFISDTKIMRNIVGRRFLETGKCDIRVKPIDLGGASTGIGFRKQFHNSSILRNFNGLLRRFSEGGLGHFGHLKSSLFHDICTTMQPAPLVHSLTLQELMATFVVYGIGTALAVLAFVTELIVKKML